MSGNTHRRHRPLNLLSAEQDGHSLCVRSDIGLVDIAVE